VSRSKRSSRENRPANRAPGKPSLRTRRYGMKALGLTLLGLGLCSLLFYQYSSRLTARADYLRARESLVHDPREAERLAELAVDNAGGNYPEAQLLRCRALAMTGEWEATLGCFSLIRDFKTCAPQELVELGESAVQAGQWKVAEESLVASLAKPGSHTSRACELLIRLDLRFRRTEDALQRCREWQVAEPMAALPWAISGDINTSRIDFASAMHDYRQALQRSPSPALQTEIRSSLAQLLIHTGETVAARREFDKLLDAGPLTGKLQLSYAQLLRTEGRNIDALAEIDQHVSRNGPSAESLKLRGIIHLDEGHVSEAVRDLKDSVKANPFDIGAQHKLAQAYLQSGDPAAAQPHSDASRKLTAATYRISEVEEQLIGDPSNSKLQGELASLRAILGK
jgi:tetratricopeptide (TPR) repeat protein